MTLPQVKQRIGMIIFMLDEHFSMNKPHKSSVKYLKWTNQCFLFVNSMQSPLEMKMRSFHLSSMCLHIEMFYAFDNSNIIARCEYSIRKTRSNLNQLWSNFFIHFSVLLIGNKNNWYGAYRNMQQKRFMLWILQGVQFSCYKKMCHMFDWIVVYTFIGLNNSTEAKALREFKSK